VRQLLEVRGQLRAHAERLDQAQAVERPVDLPVRGTTAVNSRRPSAVSKPIRTGVPLVPIKRSMNIEAGRNESATSAASARMTRTCAQAPGGHGQNASTSPSPTNMRASAKGATTVR
jgi:hypothetical protein